MPGAQGISRQSPDHSRLPCGCWQRLWLRRRRCNSAGHCTSHKLGARGGAWCRLPPRTPSWWVRRDLPGGWPATCTRCPRFHPPFWVGGPTCDKPDPSSPRRVHAEPRLAPPAKYERVEMQQAAAALLWAAEVLPELSRLHAGRMQTQRAPHLEAVAGVDGGDDGRSQLDTASPRQREVLLEQEDAGVDPVWPACDVGDLDHLEVCGLALQEAEIGERLREFRQPAPRLLVGQLGELA